MNSRIRIAGTVALAFVLSGPAFGQDGSADRKALDARVRALEATQQETTKALAALRQAVAASGYICIQVW